MSKNSSDYMAYTAQLQKNRENFRKNKDDYAWDTYTQIYESQQLDIMVPGRSQWQRDMLVTNFEEKDGELVFHDNLNPNWKEIYHQVHRLKIKSVFECGCGSGQHLINIKKTSPDVVVNGCDYSQSQIDLGFKYYNMESYEFSRRLSVKDLVSDNIDDLGEHEFVFTQAVTMHLAYERAKKFLLSMKRLSTKYILLTENLSHHDYNALIAEVLPEYERIIGENKYNMNAILLKRKSLTE